VIQVCLPVYSAANAPKSAVDGTLAVQERTQKKIASSTSTQGGPKIFVNGPLVVCGQTTLMVPIRVALLALAPAR
jgi:hypothetical protein